MAKGNSSFRVSDMTTTERAKLSVLVEKDGDQELRDHLLGALGRRETGRGSLVVKREVPDRWGIVHVLDRLEEAYGIMAMMPAATRPKAFGSGWPSYGPMTAGEITAVRNEIYHDGGQRALSAWESEQNRVRPPPSPGQITRMEQALRWPFDHLRSRPELAKAISLRSMWSVMHADIRRRCAGRGLDHDAFNRQWQEGLAVITAALIAHRVPVS